ncbi:MAG: site-2 protease family protein [Chloroflexi bacterium]|nr:site-2 protease family protein [Chloroflexota bacterium]
MLISLLSFLGVIFVLVIAHELGHFLTARAAGVKVLEFGLGFPPRILGIKRGDVTYSVNAIPLGGFVKMAGEEDPNVAGSLAGKSIPVRLLVMGAGSAMNFLLPLLLFSVSFMIPQQEVVGRVIVEQVSPESPAARAGFRPGDTILSVNGRPVKSNADLTRYVHMNLGAEVSVGVGRASGAVEELKAVPRWKPPPDQGPIGVVIRTDDPQVVRRSYPFWEAIPMGVRTSIETFVLFKNGIVSMFVGTAPVDVAGPVGIAQVTGEVARAGPGPLLEFAAFLSINLALINIFPLPALDGGRMAFVVVEWLRRGKRVPPKVEGLVHLIGFLTLIAFILLITYRDILRIISGDSLIP